jgi:enoyl-[acyl-carrier-protein] reductase (NADH)
MLLEGKKLLITGVLMDSSIAFHVAKLAQEQGAEVVLTSFGRTMKITSTIAKRLPTTPPVVELDVTDDGVAFRTNDGRLWFSDGTTTAALGAWGIPAPGTARTPGR